MCVKALLTCGSPQVVLLAYWLANVCLFVCLSIFLRASWAIDGSFYYGTVQKIRNLITHHIAPTRQTVLVWTKIERMRKVEINTKFAF